MGASGAARVLPMFFDMMPPEIHGEVLKYLPPAQLLTMIQSVPHIRCNLRSWRFVYFTTQQLVYLHRFISGVIEIKAKNGGQPKLEVIGVDVARKIIAQIIQNEFQKYEDTSRPPLEPGNFNCHYVYYIYTLIRSTTAPNDKTKQKLDVETFLRDFHYKSQIVWRFCHTVANLDYHGAIHRCSRATPNTDTWIYHLLFWLGTDYVWKQLKQSNKMNHETIAFHWKEFTRSVDGIFGESSPTSQSFRNGNMIMNNGNMIMNNDSILTKYRVYIGGCNEYHLKLINDAACRRGFENFDVYPAYMLSLGLDRALSFLHQESKEIEVIRKGELREIAAWRNVWTNFEEIEVDEYEASAPVRG